jgi:tetratricopeptide (TPR) repeat protein
MTSKLALLRQSPTLVPALAALVLFLVWASDQAGYPMTHWAPGTLIVLVLLGIALAVVRPREHSVSRPLAIALGCLAAFTVWSYLSILWAGVPGDAWEGANRTLLYLLVFALFACWPLGGRAALVLVCGWTLAMIATAAYVAIHLDSLAASALPVKLPGGRLQYPAGYANANAAEWLMAFWPALLLARSRTLAAALRGLLAGGAVLLACVALLSQSRGSLFATAGMVVLVFALLPGRMRTLAAGLAVAAGIGAAAPAVLRVGNHLVDGSVSASHLHTAIAVSFLAAALVGALFAAGAAVEGRARPGPATATRLRLASRAAVAIFAIAVLAGGLVAAGNPIERIEHGWHTFKGGYGADSTTGSRLISGLGSNRYDFYRVSLDEFLAHPLLGIGADNFQEQYLAHGRSNETPRYPHSVEMRTLSQTGLVGSALALVGLLAALLACAAAIRSPDALAGAVAAAALSAFAYWFVHGSIDWLWEFAGLGAPAFAMLGTGCASAPRATTVAGEGLARGGGVDDRAPDAGATGQGLVSGGVDDRAPDPGAVGGRSHAGGHRGGRGRSIHVPRVVLPAAAGLLALAAALSLLAPWLSGLEVESAARVWTAHPQDAYDRLADAARLNPLSDEADVLAGSIAVRRVELPRAQQQFEKAIARTPGDAYAALQLGAIASARGDAAGAQRWLLRARSLDPRDPLAREALALVRAGHTISVAALSRALLAGAQQVD